MPTGIEALTPQITIASDKFSASQLAVLGMNVTVYFHLAVGCFGARAQFSCMQTLGMMDHFLYSPCRKLGWKGIITSDPHALCAHWGVRGSNEKVQNRQGVPIPIVVHHRRSINVILKWWVSFTTGLKWNTAIRDHPDLPLFIHFMDLDAIARTERVDRVTVRLDNTLADRYTPSAASFAGQISAMFRSADPKDSYIESRHLTHMKHLRGLNPMAIRRCQITHQVQLWNNGKGPLRSSSRDDFLKNLSILANTSPDQIVNTYTLVPVSIKTTEEPESAAASAAGGSAASAVGTPHKVPHSGSGKRRKIVLQS